MTDANILVQEFITNTLTEIAKHFGKVASDVSPTTNLMESGILDSLGFVSLMSSIEHNFDVELDFDGTDPELFTTIQGLVDCTIQALSDKA